MKLNSVSISCRVASWVERVTARFKTSLEPVIWSVWSWDGMESHVLCALLVVVESSSPGHRLIASATVSELGVLFELAVQRPAEVLVAS